MNPHKALSAYVEQSRPFQWIGWWRKLPQGHAKEQMSSILFDESDSLRSLIDEEVRRQVIEFAQEDSTLQGLIEAELVSGMNDSCANDKEGDLDSDGGRMATSLTTPESKPQWKLVTEYPITDYECGIRAGERVRLRKDLVQRDHRDKPTGVVHRAGEIWTVLKGSAEPPVVVWLRQPDGEPHTWPDGEIFWTWFERVDDTSA